MLWPLKHKVPPLYSRADDYARSLMSVGIKSLGIQQTLKWFSIPRFISPVLCWVPLQARRAWGQSFLQLALQFKGGSKQDSWIGIWIVIRAECGHCGHILMPAVVN
jgi:hypothetical protein